MTGAFGVWQTSAVLPERDAFDSEVAGAAEALERRGSVSPPRRGRPRQRSGRPPASPVHDRRLRPAQHDRRVGLARLTPSAMRSVSG